MVLDVPVDGCIPLIESSITVEEKEMFKPPRVCLYVCIDLYRKDREID